MSIGIEVQGNGPTVFMIHGLGGSSNTFAPQALRLAQRYQVIRPDLPGVGRSVGLGTASIAAVVEDLVTLSEAYGPAHWVGHSLGTVICQLIATRLETRVRSLTLLGPFTEPAPAARKALGERADKVRAEGLDWFVDGYICNALAAATLASESAAIAYVRESLQRQSPARYADFCAALAAHHAIALESITAPTLLMTGDEDKVATVAAVREMSQRLPNATVQVLQACGHWPTVEQPANVTAALQAHLSSVELQS